MTEPRDTHPRKLPTFKDEREAAAFWDIHSPEEFPEEFEEVKATFARPLTKRGLTIKLDKETIEELKEIAKERGIGPSTLARMWILERLKEQKERDLHRKIS